MIDGQDLGQSMTPIEVTPANLNSASTQPTLIDKGDYTLEYKTFEKGSSADGFGFFSPAYKSLDAAKNKIGEGPLLALVNSALSQGVRTKAKFRLPELDEPDASNPDKAAALKAVQDKQKRETEALLTETKGVLLTELEAENFVPGLRGATSPQGLIKEAKAALANGNKELAAEKFKQAQEALQRQIDDSLKLD